MASEPEMRAPRSAGDCEREGYSRAVVRGGEGGRGRRTYLVDAVFEHSLQRSIGQFDARVREGVEEREGAAGVGDWSVGEMSQRRELTLEESKSSLVCLKLRVVGARKVSEERKLGAEMSDPLDDICHPFHSLFLNLIIHLFPLLIVRLGHREQQ